MISAHENNIPNDAVTSENEIYLKTDTRENMS